MWPRYLRVAFRDLRGNTSGADVVLALIGIIMLAAAAVIVIFS